MAQAAAPAALKLLTGTGPGRDSGGRKVDPGPAFKRTPPKPPTWLDGDARKVWDRILPELVRLDIVKDGDAEVLATYCVAWQEFVEANDIIRAEGMTIDARQGTLAHPAVGIRRNAAKELRSIAAHFGLTPSTEQALARSSEDDDADNPFD